MSAESNMVRPASRQTSTSRVASATSLAPQALKNSLPPPKVPVPKLKTGILSPEAPSCLNSIRLCSLLLMMDKCQNNFNDDQHHYQHFQELCSEGSSLVRNDAVDVLRHV